MMIIYHYSHSYERDVIVNILFSGTFKLKKLALQKEGFDRNVIKDNLYFLDGKQNQYIELTPELFTLINSGKAGLWIKLQSVHS